MQYRELRRGDEWEFIIIKVWTKEGSVKVINFYNPCKQLEVEHLESIWGDLNGKVIWCGDFNAHSTLWGFIDCNEIVCLNDGTGTRLDVARGRESVVDITLATRAVASKCRWEVLNGNSVGSDHYPLVI